MSDRLTSWVRTVVPGLWAALVTWLVTRIPGVAGFADQVSGAVEPIIETAVLAAVYAALRKVEPALPDWLTRVFLGSANPPKYAPANPDGVHTITDVSR